MELLAYKNITTADQEQITNFLSELAVININEDIKFSTIKIKKNYGLKLPDSIIAATAMWLKLPFVTSDKQFKQVDKLNLVYYEK